MFKTAVATCLVLSATAVGCASASDASTSSAAAVSAGATISLDDAKTQVNAVRATFEPTGAHELLFDTSLAPAYVAALKPIFAQVAPTDKLDLAGEAFSYVATEAGVDGLLDGDLVDDAVAATYQDLWSYSFMFGGLSSNPTYFTKLNGLVEHSKVGILSDLQVLELVTNGATADILSGLDALGYAYAPDTTAAGAKNLVAAATAFGHVADLAFGVVTVVPEGTGHDLDGANTPTAKLFTRTFSKLQLIGAPDEGGIAVDLGGHLATAKGDLKHEPTIGAKIARSILTGSDLREINMYLAE